MSCLRVYCECIVCGYSVVVCCYVYCRYFVLRFIGLAVSGWCIAIKRGIDVVCCMCALCWCMVLIICHCVSCAGVVLDVEVCGMLLMY